MKKILIYCSIFTMLSCSMETDIYGDKENLFRGELGDKPVLAKLSYIEETFRKADFSNNDAVEFGLTYLQEPKSERKKVYVEIYNDLTFGKVVEFLPNNSDYPADKFIPSEEFSQLSKLKYSNGMVQGFDKNENIIHTDTYDDKYINLTDNEISLEDLSILLLSSFSNPDASASYFIKKISEGNVARELNEKTIEVTKETGTNFKTDSYSFEVVKEKIYLNKNKGVVTRIEGYTHSDELKDLEVNFYGLTEDGTHYMKSSHFRNKQYSEAYDIFYLEYSDIFINDFKFQISK